MAALGNVFLNISPQFGTFNQQVQAHVAAMPNPTIHVNAQVNQNSVNNMFNNVFGNVTHNVTNIISSSINNGIQQGARQGASTLSGILGTPVVGPIVAGAVVAGVVAAAPLVGSILAGALETGLAGAAIGAGLIIAFQNPGVKAAGKALAETVGNELQEVAKPFTIEVMRAIPFLQGAFRSLKPDLQDIFSAIGPQFEQVLGGIVSGLQIFTKLIVEPIQNAKPFADALAEGFQEIGFAVGVFFRILDEHKDGAIKAMRLFFAVVAGGIELFGGLLAVLSEVFSFTINLSKTIVDEIQKIIAPVKKVLDNLALLFPGNALFKGLAVAVDGFSSGLGYASEGLGYLQNGLNTSIPDFNKWGSAVDGMGKQLQSLQLDMLDAAQAIEDHFKQLSDNVESSGRALEMANRRVADTSQGIKDAEYSLSQAQLAQKDAQKGLTEARKDAAKQLIDLRDAALQAGDAEESSYEKLTQAQARVANGDTSREAIAALLAAQNDHTVAYDKSTEAHSAYTEAQRKGIEGSDQVVAAKKRVKDAAHAEEVAERGVTKARQAHSDALYDQKKASDKYKEAVDNLTAGYDINTKAGRENIRLLGTFQDKYKEYTEALKTYNEAIATSVGVTVGKVGQLVGQALANMTALTTSTSGVGSAAGLTAGEIAKIIAGNSKVKRAQGGLVSGPGGPTDDLVPAMLSNEEFVVKGAAVKKYGVKFLNDVNTMRLAAGGSVGEIIDVAKKAGVSLGQLTTTGGSHADKSYHYSSRAVDFGGAAGVGGSASLKLAQFFYKNYGSKLLEELYAYNDNLDGYYIKNGKVNSGVYSASTKRDHRNHVHIAANPGFSGAKGGGFDDNNIPGVGGGSGVSLASLLAAAQPQLTQLGTLGYLGAAGANTVRSYAKSLASTGGTSPGTGGFTAAPAGTAQAYANSLLGKYGWDASQFGPLKSLWNGESNWNYHAKNPSSGAYGIPQALPGSKMASTGADWRDNYKTQVQWGMGYIKGRYGNPAEAWSRWQGRSPHWYDEGGWLTNDKIAVSGTKPEAVLDPEESENFKKLVANNGTGGSKEFHFHVHGNINTPVSGEVLMKQFEFMARRL